MSRSHRGLALGVPHRRRAVQQPEQLEAFSLAAPVATEPEPVDLLVDVFPEDRNEKETWSLVRNLFRLVFIRKVKADVDVD